MNESTPKPIEKINSADAHALAEKYAKVAMTYEELANQLAIIEGASEQAQVEEERRHITCPICDARVAINSAHASYPEGDLPHKIDEWGEVNGSQVTVTMNVRGDRYKAECMLVADP